MILKFIHHNLPIIPLLVIISALFSCTNGNDFARVVAKDSELKIFVDSLQTSNRTYKNCSECKLSYLEGTKITGFSNRMPPKMLYHQREIELGNFEYDTYSILADKIPRNQPVRSFFVTSVRNKKPNLWSSYLFMSIKSTITSKSPR